MSKPYKCPVCDGIGQLPIGFYNPYSTGSTASAIQETCKTCSGQGIIWSRDYCEEITPEDEKKFYDKAMSVTL